MKQGVSEEVSSFFEKNKDIYQDLGGETGIEKNRMWWIDDGDVNNHGIMQAIGLKEFIPYYCHNDGTGTFKRYKKKSFEWYKEVIHTNGQSLIENN